MPSRCVVPGCKSNYDTSLKDETGTRLTTNYKSIFHFPKNEELRKKWISAIPRKNWSPTQHSKVCSMHFLETDIMRYDKWLQPDETIQNLLLAHPRLDKNAVPSIFPNLPSYLTKPVPLSRKNPEERRNKITENHENLIKNFENSDMIESFEHLTISHQNHVSLSDCWNTKLVGSKFYFYTLD